MINLLHTKNSLLAQRKTQIKYITQENGEHFSNRKEPNALEMTNVVKTLTRFLNAHNDRCYKQELISTCSFYKLPRRPLQADPK